MNEIKLSRRAVLTGGSAVAAFYVLGASGVKAAASREGTCADPDRLSAGEKSLRQSLEYEAVFSDSETVCAACAFFQASDDGLPCGKCVILNGPVDATGHCLSWSPKE